MVIHFTEKEIAQMHKAGRSPEQVAKQFSKFENGFAPTRLVRPAVKGDGIVVLSDEEIFNLLEQYDAYLEGKRIAKFVPASGAASRMFKELYGWLEGDDAPADKVDFFLQNLSKFAFKEDLENALKRDGASLDEAIAGKDYKKIIRYLLHEEGLNYGNLPKGLLKFHRYTDCNRTAAEEHLVEAALYARNADGTCNLHFTVSPQHEVKFKELLEEVRPIYEKRFGVTYHFSFSVQSPASDTLAADLQNQPFHGNTGELLFRPGGHGALLDNLNRLDFDLVFVKNIDNVTKEGNLNPTTIYKKVLGSYLLELKSKTDFYLKKLATGNCTAELLNEAKTFAREKLLLTDVTDENLFDKLNRPMRICGMVKNEGEPGGGPFWTRNSHNEITLQIVESSQMDLATADQKTIVGKATHFNPVDMACAFKDYCGRLFDLSHFVDEETGFISSKSYGDRTLKAMELPGLWNGSMAHWITLFVEVPIETFNPVKTVFDLLKKEHGGKD